MTDLKIISNRPKSCPKSCIGNEKTIIEIQQTEDKLCDCVKVGIIGNQHLR
jgi:hypothetical protein